MLHPCLVRTRPSSRRATAEADLPGARGWEVWDGPRTRRARLELGLGELAGRLEGKGIRRRAQSKLHHVSPRKQGRRQPAGLCLNEMAFIVCEPDLRLRRGCNDDEFVIGRHILVATVSVIAAAARGNLTLSV